MEESLRDRLRRVADSAAEARLRRGGGDDVSLMLAVKRRDAATCIEAALALRDLGQIPLLGHNHVQEARATTSEVRAACPDARIHLIGHLQTNKINHALASVDAIDTIDSLRLVERLDARVEPPRVLDVLVQVNTSGEATKSGVDPDGACALAEAVATSAHLHLVGLMTVGALSSDESEIRRSYARLAELRDRLRADHPDCKELSMGMSSDFALAIAEGATQIRIGQAVLGPRKK